VKIIPKGSAVMKSNETFVINLEVSSIAQTTTGAGGILI
jgi:hypothetical protein